MSKQPAVPLYQERHRPQYHYSPPQWWLNDPNGLIYYEGEYHLFYQYHPHDTVWGPMHWGHAVSTDLVHWETLPIALYPDEIGTIFSGCVVLDADNTSGLVPDGGLVAVYSYDTQQQGVAYSIDAGRTWSKHDGNPIMEAIGKDFRDPKVFWHEATQRWVMIIAAGQEIHLYTAPDLLNWTLASKLTHAVRGGHWEVPDLLPLELNGETWWLLIISIDPGGLVGGSATRYMIGQFDGTTFTDAYPDEVLWLDHGPDNYAGTTFANLPGEPPLFIGWMNNWLYANEIPTGAWRGQFTLPRRLGLTRRDGKVRLTQQPIHELEALRTPVGRWRGLTLNGPLTLSGVEGPALELALDAQLGTARAFTIEFWAGDQTVRVRYDHDEATLTVTRPALPQDKYQTNYSVSLTAPDGHLQLRLFLDHSALEIFGNDGAFSSTSLVFMDAPVDRVRLIPVDGTAQVIAVDAYRMASIWEN